MDFTFSYCAVGLALLGVVGRLWWLSWRRMDARMREADEDYRRIWRDVRRGVRRTSGRMT